MGRCLMPLISLSENTAICLPRSKMRRVAIIWNETVLGAPRVQQQCVDNVINDQFNSVATNANLRAAANIVACWSFAEIRDSALCGMMEMCDFLKGRKKEKSSNSTIVSLKKAWRKPALKSKTQFRMIEIPESKSSANNAANLGTNHATPSYEVKVVPLSINASKPNVQRDGYTPADTYTVLRDIDSANIGATGQIHAMSGRVKHERMCTSKELVTRNEFEEAIAANAQARRRRASDEVVPANEDGDREESKEQVLNRQIDEIGIKTIEFCLKRVKLARRSGVSLNYAASSIIDCIYGLLHDSNHQRPWGDDAETFPTLDFAGPLRRARVRHRQRPKPQRRRDRNRRKMRNKRKSRNRVSVPRLVDC